MELRGERVSLSADHELLKKISIFLTALWVGAGGELHAEVRISRDLEARLNRGDGALPIIMVMNDMAPAIQALGGPDLSKSSKIRMLQSLRFKSQQDLRSTLKELHNQYQMTSVSADRIEKVRFYWSTNSVRAVVSRDILTDLMDREDIRFIMLDRKVPLSPQEAPAVLDGNDPELLNEYTYGLERIGLPELLNRQSNLNGRGVRVGIIDSGIDPKHPEFAGRKIQYKNFVPLTEARDDHGHGTHVAATIAGFREGSVRIGIAPGAELLVARVFDESGSAGYSAFMEAMEWMIDPDGNSKTDDMPAVVNNSWGGMASSDLDEEPFFEMVTRWIEFNIFPCFAAGNSGPSRESMGTPGAYPHSFAVGATDAEDRVADFSSRGPVRARIRGELREFVKPDVSAPGVEVLSALPKGKYAKWSGTSMATPHVTGVVALIKQIAPTLTVNEVRELIEKSADKITHREKNNESGSGRINLGQIFEQLQRQPEIASGDSEDEWFGMDGDGI